MTVTATETTISSPQGVMSGVTPAAQVPSIHTATQEPVAPRTSTNDPDRTFSVDDIERVRREEKNKVYGRLEELQEQLRVFQQESDARREIEQSAVHDAEEAARLKAESEMDLRSLLEKKEREWTEQLHSERLEREKAFALLEKEREWSALESYKSQAVRQAEDDILPELLDDVTGNTQAEIDASIARLAAKSKSILENTASVLAQQRQSQPGVRVTAPPVGPMENQSANEQLQAPDVRGMSMSDYAKYRGQFGVTGGPVNRGLFG
jgi:hypothetical protein